MARRSWLVAVVAMAFGTTFVFLDQHMETHPDSAFFEREIYEMLEIIVFIPGSGVFAFLVSEYLRVRHQHERHRHREQHLLQLGRIAGAVAHEVRNPLHNIHLILNELKSARPEMSGDPLCLRLNGNLDRINRAVELVYQLSKPSVAGALDSEFRTDLNAVIRDAVEAMKSSTSLPIEVSPSGAPLIVSCQEASVRIILDNLLRNAIEAGRSPIAIACRSEHGSCEVSVKNPGSLPASVTDQQQNVPVDSTKPNGLGLGLYLSRQIAINSGGSLEISSHGDLVTATLRLPSVAATT